MIGYDYTDTAMQPPSDEDEDLYIEAEEKVIELLENNGYGIIADMLVCTEKWVNAINAYLAEQRKQKDEY